MSSLSADGTEEQSLRDCVQSSVIKPPSQCCNDDVGRRSFWALPPFVGIIKVEGVYGIFGWGGGRVSTTSSNLCFFFLLCVGVGAFYCSVPQHRLPRN